MEEFKSHPWLDEETKKLMVEWRRSVHQQPELEFDCHRTAEFAAQHLKQFGYTVRVINPDMGAWLDAKEVVATIDVQVPRDGTVQLLRHIAGGVSTPFAADVYDAKIRWLVGDLAKGEVRDLQILARVRSGALPAHDAVRTTVRLTASVPVAGAPDSLRAKYDDRAEETTSIVRAGEVRVSHSAFRREGGGLVEVAVDGVVSNLGPSQFAALPVRIMVIIPKGATVELLETTDGILSASHPTASQESLWVVPLKPGASQKFRCIVRGPKAAGKVQITALIDESATAERIINAKSDDLGFTVFEKL